MFVSRSNPGDKTGVNPITRASAAQLAAAELRAEIAAGRWADRLPGARVLAKRLGVSPPTAALALVDLAAEGLLEKTGERKAFRVASHRKSGARSASGGTAKRLLILTHTETGQITQTSRRTLEKLREQATARGWRVEFQVVDFVHVKRPQRSWDRLIQVEPGTSVIALYGRPALAQWALRRKVRMFFLGGVTEGLPIPMVAVKSARMVETAFERLTSQGHWKIILPLCDRAETYKQTLRQVVRNAVESTGRSFVKSYHTPESDYLTPDVTWRILESLFATDPPTAMVLLDWKELVTAHCFLNRIGMRIPQDVSLILLNDQMEAEWFVPALTRFRFPERKILRAMIHWLEHPDEKEPRTLNPPADFIEGATIAPPRPVEPPAAARKR